MAWATCGRPHASLNLHTIRRLLSPHHYLPSYVHSCFHLSSLLLLRYNSYSHTNPSIPHSCKNVLSTLTTTSSTHHTSFTYSLAGPILKIQRHLVFDFRPTTAQSQIPWALAPGAHVWGAPSYSHYFLFGAPGRCPLLQIFKAAPPRTPAVGVNAVGAWGFHNNFFLGPPNLHNVLGRPPTQHYSLLWFNSGSTRTKVHNPGAFLRHFLNKVQGVLH